MTISDWVIIVAILLAPILAVQVQKWIERAREKRQRKIQLFQTLMSTRLARVSVAHVEALNMIDFEFSGRRWPGVRRVSETERAVLDAWRVYHDLLNDAASFQDDHGRKRLDDAFIELLFTMSEDLGYHFDRVQLRKGAYSPVAHAELEADQHRLRKYMMEILEGRRATSVLTVSPTDLMKATEAMPPGTGQTDSDGSVEEPERPS